MSANLPVTATVTAVRPLNDDTFLVMLSTEAGHPVAASYLPGQFLQLSLPGVGEIPVSYCGVPTADGSIELCIRRVGRVTTLLGAVMPGTVVAVRGPFGRGFPLKLYPGQDLLLVAGGLGIAPIRSLLLAVVARRAGYGRVTLLFGARSVKGLLFLDELQELAGHGVIAMHLGVDALEPGFAAVPGCHARQLPELLEGLIIDPAHTWAALCGPPAAYPCLVAAASGLGVADERIHLSLERRMKCGVGHCGHCAVGCYICCVDGPVFSYTDLAGIEGALA
jgi:NAD(P)H-flavin reductase